MRRSKKFTLSRSQKSLPFASRGAKSGVLSYAGVIERRVLVSGFALLFIVGASYVYFVMASVAHVAAREEMSENVARLSAEVAGLEASYFARSTAITEPYARSLGFVSARDKIFIEKTSLALSRDSR